ncbi:dissimilatory adenylylsulfate reductase beta subunit [Caldanaerobius fijiensis DSM 17918]|uniref:Dissimilatory adenylylsulfate reductase beta subunit n=1 Tax=Caldanaerobius fijiensis DSM 17918 TaxID=1121256 RepID=A0A1M5C6T5_9THEO|nr:ferredoxin family protein [Caldanaerobius fijiensis]SHF50366.1 dissimilatory adenylylsulfate reductase beta subunit [Caldanaerobius fijiensis DSM 17918]
MAVRIDRELCNGCGKLDEPLCVRICPGDLLYKNTDGKAAIRDTRDCWDCAACIKECPKQAIEMYLPAQIGGRGSTLKARKSRDKIIWMLKRADGVEEIIEIEAHRIV